MFDERYLDLQFFAEDPAEDDDLTEEEFGEEFDLEEEDEEEVQEEGEEIEVQEEGEEIKETVGKKDEDERNEGSEPKDEKYFTKTDVERIIQERFLRDPSRVAAKQLEEMTGMTLPQIAEYIRQKQEEEEVSNLVEEKGWDEEDAKRHVQAKRQNRELLQRTRISEQQLQVMQGQFNYIQDKAKFANDPLIRKYEAEIDAFSQYGRDCTFETAVNYVLGQKVRSGELIDAIKNGAVNRTLANLEKQNKVKVEQGSYSGRSAAEEGLDPFTKSMAARFGLSAKEIKAEQARIARERRGGRR